MYCYGTQGQFYSVYTVPCCPPYMDYYHLQVQTLVSFLPLCSTKRQHNSWSTSPLQQLFDIGLVCLCL